MTDGSPQMGSARTCILYIEDNPMNWRLVQRLLSQAGYEMHWAEDGLKGCEMALALKPALILLDINLPGLSGFEVATKLRQSASLKGTLIVALTAKTMRIDRETALVTGCDGFISKPIDPFLFVGQVEGYLGGHREHLESGREGAALRQFSQQVVEHLEAQLRDAETSNQKLLDAQGELERRSQNLSRLLALSKEIIPIRDVAEILRRVLGQLRAGVRLEHLRVYRLHDSGTYFYGLELNGEDFDETPVLAVDHPLAVWAKAISGGAVLAGGSLRQSSAWEPGVELGWWGPRAQGFFLPLPSRSGDGELWGFLTGDRLEEPLQPFEAELAAMYGGMLQVSLENAGLIAHLDETSQALGTSYEGLESAYEALKDAQRALGAQNQKTALGGLFLNVAHRLEDPVQVLKVESAALSRVMDRPELPALEEREQCHVAMARIHQAISQVDSLVKAVLRRAGQGEANSPQWLHLHDLVQGELELLKADGILPLDLPVTVNLQASRDLLYGVHSDFAELLTHLVQHALGGQPRQLHIRSWGGQRHFRLEVEDDGTPIEARLLGKAFEPFSELQREAPIEGRLPGRGLPACAQLMHAYGGTLQIQYVEVGSLVRISLPMD